jgi:hypothetical protein
VGKEKLRQTVQIERALDESMQNRLALAEDVGAQSRGSRDGVPAFRCGVPFRGDEMPIRDAGPCFEFQNLLRQGSPIEVSWGADVSWGKRIRVLVP